MRDEIIEFLKEVDRRLEEDVSLVMIGGASAILQGLINRMTRDIDFYSSQVGKIEMIANLSSQESPFAKINS